MADEKRGLLGRVRRRVSGGISKVKEGLKAIHEEARYPGRPPGFQAADNPFWQDAPAPKAEVPTTVEPAPEPVAPVAGPAVPKPTDSTDRDGEPFWFLEGNPDVDGWDQTNPSQKWRERHGTEGEEQ